MMVLPYSMLEAGIREHVGQIAVERAIRSLDHPGIKIPGLQPSCEGRRALFTTAAGKSRICLRDAGRTRETYGLGLALPDLLLSRVKHRTEVTLSRASCLMAGEGTRMQANHFLKTFRRRPAETCDQQSTSMKKTEDSRRWLLSAR